MKIEQKILAEIVARALKEDVGAGDVTSTALIPEAAVMDAVMVCRVPGVIAGLPVAAEVFCQVHNAISFHALVDEGTRVEPGARIAEISGPARAVLEGERVALNFMQRMSGIATLTRECVDAVSGCDCRILDTRKTTPGLRVLEKYAVRVGGGYNHRMGLYDQVLIKDNHLRALLPEVNDLPGAVALAVTRARESVGNTMRVEVEAENLAMVETAIGADADIIMLDNMSDDEMREASDKVRAHRIVVSKETPLTEASGGLTLERLGDVAATGVDMISLGALTHSAPVLDLALET